MEKACCELRVRQRRHTRKSGAALQQLLFLDEVTTLPHRLKQTDQNRFQYSRRNLTIPLSSYDLQDITFKVPSSKPSLQRLTDAFISRIQWTWTSNVIRYVRTSGRNKFCQAEITLSTKSSRLQYRLKHIYSHCRPLSTYSIFRW